MEKYSGTSNPNKFANLKRDFGIAMSVKEITTVQEDIIFDLVAKETLIPISGITELLEALKIYGVNDQLPKRIVVFLPDLYKNSSALNTILDKINISKYFDEIMSGEDMANSKPAPDIFLATANKLHIEPSECIVIKDSINGILAAVKANIKCIGYINISSGSQDLSKSTVVIDDFNKLDVRQIVNLT